MLFKSFVETVQELFTYCRVLHVNKNAFDSWHLVLNVVVSTSEKGCSDLNFTPLHVFLSNTGFALHPFKSLA